MDVALAMVTLPTWCATILANGWVHLVVRVALTSAYWIAGLDKLFNWKQALAETRSFHLPMAKATVAATIFVELVGSVLVILNYYIGSVLLGGFTFCAMLVAYPFWRHSGRDRVATLVGFCEHLGLVAAFIMAVTM